LQLIYVKLSAQRETQRKQCLNGQPINLGMRRDPPAATVSGGARQEKQAQWREVKAEE